MSATMLSIFLVVQGSERQILVDSSDSDTPTASPANSQGPSPAQQQDDDDRSQHSSRGAFPSGGAVGELRGSHTFSGEYARKTPHLNPPRSSSIGGLVWCKNNLLNLLRSCGIFVSRAGCLLGVCVVGKKERYWGLLRLQVVTHILTQLCKSLKFSFAISPMCPAPAISGVCCCVHAESGCRSVVTGFLMAVCVWHRSIASALRSVGLGQALWEGKCGRCIARGQTWQPSRIQTSCLSAD